MLQLRNLTMDRGDPDRLAEFWEAALGYEKRSSDGQYTVLVHPDGGRPFLILQRVPEPKVGKNPLHLDLRADDREAEVRRLVGLGAREVGTGRAYGRSWTTLADPEANEFCVVG